MRIANRDIGSSHPPYIIAEIGVNHDGSVDRAIELVEHAKAAGADAIKLQYFETDRLMSKSAKLAAYQAAAGETDPIAMLRRLEFSLADMDRVVNRAHALGLHAIVTCFSTELVAEAEKLPFDAYKTASPDIIHRPLLHALAMTGKPLIVSTGASELEEVERAVTWLSEWGAAERLALLQCVSCYPTGLENAAFEGIGALSSVSAGPIGYSDHTREIDTSWRVVALGACILEKHLTYNQLARGPDHAASLEPDQFARYVAYAKDAHAGTSLAGLRPWIDRDGRTVVRMDDPVFVGAVKEVLPCERDVRTVSRQSLIATRDLPTGHALMERDITIKRPGTGIPPFELDLAIGRTLARPVEADTVITWDALGGET